MPTKTQPATSRNAATASALLVLAINAPFGIARILRTAASQIQRLDQPDQVRIQATATKVSGQKNSRKLYSCLADKAGLDDGL